VAAAALHIIIISIDKNIIGAKSYQTTLKAETRNKNKEIQQQQQQNKQS